jgi:tetratricopeptide (TPR) repeat protein
LWLSHNLIRRSTNQPPYNNHCDGWHAAPIQFRLENLSLSLNEPNEEDEKNSKSWPSAPSEVKKHFSALLEQARKSEDLKSGGDTERLYEHIVAYAQEWGLDCEICDALKNLGQVYLDSRKFSKALTVLQSLLRRQESELGKNHSALARTEMLIGISHHQRREFPSALKSFRSAVIRFEQSDEVDRDLFIECLCGLSSIYRDTGKLGSSRTCIKQAYRLLPGNDAPLRLQSLVLEELAAVVLAEHKYKPARTAYERLVAMKSELLKSEQTDIVGPLIKLGLRNFSLHEFNAAEEALFKAGQFYYELGYRDRTLLIRNLETLAGVLRHQGQFVQASLIEESALELYNFEETGSHGLYGHLLKEANQAELAGDIETAKVKYREALSLLELQNERGVADRLPILARLYLCSSNKQSHQRVSLLAEIEDALCAAFAGSIVDCKTGLRKLALIYRLCGKESTAKDLCRLGDELSKQPPAIGKVNYLILRKDSS